MNNEINNDMNEDDFRVYFTLDDGTEVEGAVIAIFPVNGRNYIALLPLNHHDKLDPEEVFLYRYSTTGSKDSIQLDIIETDDEYNKVADAFDLLVDECN